MREKRIVGVGVLRLAIAKANTFAFERTKLLYNRVAALNVAARQYFLRSE